MTINAPKRGTEATNPRLSVCIATRNRGTFIGETLRSILDQQSAPFEIVVVDGASNDETEQVMSSLASAHPNLRYFRERENLGVDRDYEKAVSYATGDYCWLMTDDDLMRPGAVARVLEALDGSTSLVIVNADLKDADFSTVLSPRMLDFATDRRYCAEDSEAFFSEVGDYLSFIGSVVIERDLWMKRDRASYYDTLFIHVGVIFQSPPIAGVRVIAEPQLSIRYGNAMWTPRRFEIWMFKWPALIWSFSGYSEDSKSKICPREPWQSFRKLFMYRAIGGFGGAEYRRFFVGRIGGWRAVSLALVAFTPAALANAVSAFYCVTINRNARAALYDISRSQHATWISRFAARLMNV